MQMYRGSFFFSTSDKAVKLDRRSGSTRTLPPLYRKECIKYRLCCGIHTFYRDDVNADNNHATHSAESIEKWFIIVGTSTVALKFNDSFTTQSYVISTRRLHAPFDIFSFDFLLRDIKFVINRRYVSAVVTHGNPRR